MNIGPIVRAMRHNRTRVVLIVLEIGMTLAIVTNCINVILGEREKMTRPSGFDDEHIVRLLQRPFAQEFKDNTFVGTTIARDLRTIASVPGVRAVANTHFQLWEGGGSSSGVAVRRPASRWGPVLRDQGPDRDASSHEGRGSARTGVASEPPPRVVILSGSGQRPVPGR
jgi:hypothetical protein